MLYSLAIKSNQIKPNQTKQNKSFNREVNEENRFEAGAMAGAWAYRGYWRGRRVVASVGRPGYYLPRLWRLAPGAPAINGMEHARLNHGSCLTITNDCIHLLTY